MVSNITAHPGSTLPITVLLVSAHTDDHHSMHTIFSGSSWNLRIAFTVNDALRQIRADHGEIGVVICEHSLPDGDWRSLLTQMDKRSARPSLIVSSRLADERLWADVLSFGAFDLLLGAPFEPDEVLRVTASAWSAWHRAVRPAAPPRLGQGSARSLSSTGQAAFATGG